MNNVGGVGLIPVILVTGLLLITATAASVLLNSSNDVLSIDIEKMTNEAVDEITTYIQIKDVMGKYNSITSNQRIQQIAILIKPLVSFNLDASNLLLKLSNGQQVRILPYNGNTAKIDIQPLFDHDLWTNVKTNSYSILVIHDTDESILQYSTFNENTDMAYLILQLPEGFSMKNGDLLEISLMPTAGMIRTITVEAPLPIRQVVSLY